MSARYDISLHVDPSPSKDFKHFEVYRAPELPIIAVDQGLKTFTIEGKFASWYDVGDDLEVTLSTGNDKDYTVVSVNETTGDTVITVAETIPNPTADGLIKQKLLKQLAIRSSSTSFEDKGLPSGFYYYVIYAVDKNDNYSDPSNIIIKTAPEFITPPAQPTGLSVVRSTDLQTVEIFWHANREEDLKGYVIYRSFDGLNYHVAAVVGSTANNYKDTKIPPKQDTDSSTTPVIYSITAINKAFIESTPAGPTFPMAVPIVTGLRGIIDYLSINVYWNYNRPEDGIVSYDIVYRPIGTPTWILAGTAMHPRTSFRIEGPLVKNSTYEIGIIVKPHTGAVSYEQPLPIPITIPDYMVDTTPPTQPRLLEADLDPQSNRIFMSWRSVKIDDDLLRYQIWWAKLFDIILVDTLNSRFKISGSQGTFLQIGEKFQVWKSSFNNGTYTIKDIIPFSPPPETVIEVEETIPSSTADGQLFQLMLDGVTNQNNWTFRNFRTYFGREDSPLDRAFVLAVTAIDRSGNQSVIPSSDYYLIEYWMSQDLLGPAWLDIVRNIPAGFFNNLAGGTTKPGFEAQFYLQWNDSSRAAKHFRRYLVFESIKIDHTTLEPIFDFNDEKQIRTHSTDNTFIIYNNYNLRGLKTTTSEREIVAVDLPNQTFTVNGNQVGHFKVGNTLRVYGSSGGANDGDYTIVSRTYIIATMKTVIKVAEAIPVSTATGYCYDVELDGTKWYTVLAEDWFGDRYHALPNYPWIEVK